MEWSLLTVWPWASDYTFSSVSALCFKMSIRRVPTPVGLEIMTVQCQAPSKCSINEWRLKLFMMILSGVRAPLPQEREVPI